MKLKITILTFLFTLSSIATFAQNSQSDYEIQKQFKTQYAQYQDKVEEVSSPDSAKQLIESIREFDQKYSTHEDLLNKALHPDTYDKRIEELKQSSVVAMNRLQTIDKQTKQLANLEEKVSNYEQDLTQLNQRTDSLQQAMQKSIQSEKQLSSMLREYRQNLEQRDELILAFIDSMVVAYQKMDLKSMQDLENIDKKSRIQSDGDALEMIRNISAENIEILENNSDNLRLQDYMRMAEVQQQFQQMWNRLGQKIKEVYDGENAETMAQEVDQNINKWDELLKGQAFAALNDSLAQNEISMSEFSTSDEFYSSLNNYLDSKVKQSKEDPSESSYTDFQNFQRFWNRVELQWSSNFVDAGLIDREQMATINQKVDTWAEHAQPRSNNLLVYLLGASVLVMLALGVMLIREKKNKCEA